jgi:DNA gyrase/topoisomerase IV subunit B
MESDSTREYPSILMDGYDKNHDTLVIDFKRGVLDTFFTAKMSLELLKTHLPEKVADTMHSELFEDFGTILAFKPDTTIITKNKVEYHAYPFKLMKGLFNNDKLYSSLTINYKLNGEEVNPYDFFDLYQKDSLLGEKAFSYNFDIATKENFPIKFLGTFAYDKSSMDFDSIGSVNLLRTHTGKHITIFQRALGKALSKLNPLVKIPDAKYGLRSFTLSFSVEPFFEGQTKNKLGNFKDKGYNENSCIESLGDYLYENVIQSDVDFFTGLCNKIVEYKRSLDRLSKKDFIMSHVQYASKDPTASLGMGARVWDCTSSKIQDRELYITEGKSAGNSLLPVRDLTKHAVLGLRGVPMNAAVRGIETIVQNKEYKSIINVLGTGVTPFIKMEKRRYSKIIIASDADPAGKFIRALLLGFFGTYLLPWIEEGLVYCLVPPLYKQGDKFLYDDTELDKKKPFVRFKGLGEMNPSEVKEHLIQNRKLIQVNPNDIDEALSLIINEHNERKKLSQELGILVGGDEFMDLIDDTQSEITDSMDNSQSDDEFEDDL